MAPPPGGLRAVIELIEAHELALLVLGLAAFGVVGLPHVLSRQPLSYPVVFVAVGVLLFSFPLGLIQPDPIEFAETTETLTEIGVITALMGAGLAINRVPGWKAWGSTVKLLAITMPLTIAAVAVLGWWALGLTPAAAVLLGAVLAPTDPVLASDVQVSAPAKEEDDDEVRFALTSEAGLNDGLAFPFTNLAILIALNGVAPSGWLADFLLVEVLYKLTVGLLGGVVVGRVLAWGIFARRSPLTRIRDGMIALAATLIAYAVTEMVGGYGFLAVFVAAVVIRNQERKHSYLEVMHQFSDQIERLLSAVVLILFGGALATGILRYLDWRGVLVAALIVLVVRPLAGMAGLARSPMPQRERAAVAFFGIRGVGSFYYLAYASNQVEFLQVEQVWAITALVVLISVVIHGVTATPAMAYIDRESE
ncbi:MAG TPA: cation:proton antiporter [Acidimicrobiia bacterium]|nr:cation:proton antiporter [Acidimicrobiia bacterium]